jgi:hypothetical protein
MNSELTLVQDNVKGKQDQLAEVISKVEELKVSVPIVLATIKYLYHQTYIYELLMDSLSTFLQRVLQETLDEKNRLEAEVTLTGNRLQRAEKLTVGLADEQVRWAQSVDTLGDQIEKLIGDVFISAACISYYGPFTGTYRTEMVS